MKKLFVGLALVAASLGGFAGDVDAQKKSGGSKSWGSSKSKSSTKPKSNWGSSSKKSQSTKPKSSWGSSSNSSKPKTTTPKTNVTPSSQSGGSKKWGSSSTAPKTSIPKTSTPSVKKPSTKVDSKASTASKKAASKKKFDAAKAPKSVSGMSQDKINTRDARRQNSPLSSYDNRKAPREWDSYDDGISSSFGMYMMGQTVANQAAWIYHNQAMMSQARLNYFYAQNPGLQAAVLGMTGPVNPNYVVPGMAGNMDLMYSDHYVTSVHAGRGFGFFGFVMTLLGLFAVAVLVIVVVRGTR
jgi:hypothetical protein